MYPAAMAVEVLRNFRDYMLTAPDEVGAALAFVTAPPDRLRTGAGARPTGRRGHLLLRRRPRRRTRGVWSRCSPSVLRESTWSSRCRTSRCSSSSTRPTRRACRTTGRPTSYDDLPDEAIDALAALRHEAGFPADPDHRRARGRRAVARIDDDATAFGQRTAPWNIHYLSIWPDPAATAENIAYTREAGRRPQAVVDGACLPELHRRRGRRSGGGGLRPRAVRAARRAQGDVGPHEPVPPQPEHPTGRLTLRLVRLCRPRS